MVCIYTRLHAFASLGGVFSLFSPLNIYISLFCSLPAPCLLPCSLLHSPGAWPSVPPLLLPSCRVSSLLLSLYLRRARPEDLLRPSACRAVCRAACLLLVSHQAQDNMAVWADAACICPRPDPLLSVMCCRVFRCPFRGVRPSVCVCVLLPCVVWWQ